MGIRKGRVASTIVSAWYAGIARRILILSKSTASGRATLIGSAGPAKVFRFCLDSTVMLFCERNGASRRSMRFDDPSPIPVASAMPLTLLTLRPALRGTASSRGRLLLRSKHGPAIFDQKNNAEIFR